MPASTSTASNEAANLRDAAEDEVEAVVNSRHSSAYLAETYMGWPYA